MLLQCVEREPERVEFLLSYGLLLLNLGGLIFFSFSFFVLSFFVLICLSILIIFEMKTYFVFLICPEIIGFFFVVRASLISFSSRFERSWRWWQRFFFLFEEEKTFKRSKERSEKKKN